VDLFFFVVVWQKDYVEDYCKYVGNLPFDLLIDGGSTM